MFTGLSDHFRLWSMFILPALGDEFIDICYWTFYKNPIDTRARLVNQLWFIAPDLKFGMITTWDVGRTFEEFVNQGPNKLDQLSIY